MTKLVSSVFSRFMAFLLVIFLVPLLFGRLMVRKYLGSSLKEVPDVPFKEIPYFKQIIAFCSGFVIKPVYTIASLIIILLTRNIHEKDVAALRRALTCFFVGENFCAANYLLYGETSFLFEYLHSIGMTACFGLTTFSLIEGIDKRILKYSPKDQKCAFLGLCSSCIKYDENASCGLKQFFLFIALSLLIICFLPLTAPILKASYQTKILGARYHYSHHELYQIFEQRYSPLVAIILFLITQRVLLFQKDPIPFAKMTFSAASGFIGFSFFRYLLYHSYRKDLTWFEFWEEATEFLFIAGVGVALYKLRTNNLNAQAVTNKKS